MQIPISGSEISAKKNQLNLKVKPNESIVPMQERKLLPVPASRQI